MIIIDESRIKVPKNINCPCKDKFFIIIIDYLLEKSARRAPIYQCFTHDSGSNALDLYMSDPKPKQDLVVSKDLAKGSEAEYLMNLTDDPEYISRSCGFLFEIGMDLSFASWSLQNIITLDKSHKCELMLDWVSRPQNFFLSERLLQMNLKLSPTLSLPLVYKPGSNPILECFTDQINCHLEQGFEVSELLGHLDQELKKGITAWKFSNLIPKQDWIGKLKADVIFYKGKHQEEVFEDVLLETLRNFSSCNIKVVSLTNRRCKTFGSLLTKDSDINMLEIRLPQTELVFFSVMKISPNHSKGIQTQLGNSDIAIALNCLEIANAKEEQVWKILKKHSLFQ